MRVTYNKLNLRTLKRGVTFVTSLFLCYNYFMMTKRIKFHSETRTIAMHKNSNINFKLNSDTIENLQTFSQILSKDISTILNEALEQYFDNEQQKLLEKNMDDENALTNLDFNEFWDDIEI